MAIKRPIRRPSASKRVLDGLNQLVAVYNVVVNESNLDPKALANIKKAQDWLIQMDRFMAVDQVYRLRTVSSVLKAGAF